jgi:hypothetical protein
MCSRELPCDTDFVGAISVPCRVEVNGQADKIASLRALLETKGFQMQASNLEREGGRERARERGREGGREGGREEESHREKERERTKHIFNALHTLTIVFIFTHNIIKIPFQFF